jgi:hypothetical protein
MQENDHLVLAMELIRATPVKMPWLAKAAFLIGNLEPDLNFFTYARASLAQKTLRGHNAENSREHVLKCLNRLDRKTLWTPLDYFSLGTVVHYVADAFTFPHNALFSGSLRAHVAYEKVLHREFRRARGKSRTAATIPWQETAAGYYLSEHLNYVKSEKTPENDCTSILRACRTIYRRLTAHLLVPANVGFEDARIHNLAVRVHAERY